ncbi:MAG: DUF6282 family protein [Synergistaceae bacterium]
MIENIDCNFYDLHVHCGPEGIERKYDFMELDEMANKNNVRGIVAKSHFFSTVPWSYSSKKHGAGKLHGSLVLNHYQGGINHYAVASSASLKYQGKPCLSIVWMPTIHAKGHIEMQREHGQTYDIPAEWTDGIMSPASSPLNEIEPIYILNEKTKQETEKVIKIIAEQNLTLATGHLTKDEILWLVPNAVSHGVKKIILTHPLYDATALSCSDIKALTSYNGVYAEQSYGLMLIDNLPIQKIIEQIKAVGAEKTILTTDLGQKQNEDPPQGMKTFIKLLKKEGITEEELNQMINLNPDKIINN